MDDDDAGRNINQKAERGNIIQISKYQETPLFIKVLVDFAHGCILVIHTHTHRVLFSSPVCLLAYFIVQEETDCIQKTRKYCYQQLRIRPTRKQKRKEKERMNEKSFHQCCVLLLIKEHVLIVSMANWSLNVFNVLCSLSSKVSQNYTTPSVPQKLSIVSCTHFKKKTLHTCSIPELH